MSTFSARDLALLLPDKVVGDSYGLRHTDMKDGTEGELLKPKVDASKKVTRYFSGKAPTWAGGGENWPTGEEEPTVDISIDRTNRKDFKPAVVEDRRLARLAKVSAATSSSETEVIEEDVQPRRRRVYEAQVIVDDEEEEESFLGTNHEQDEGAESKSSSSRMMSVGVSDTTMDDENDIAGRRARVLKRMAEKQAEEAAAAAVASSSSSTISGSGRIRAHAEEITVGDDEEEEEEEEEEESESEYETDSDESDDQVIKPVFVPKAKRATLQELAMKEAEEKIKEDKRLVEKEDRKRQTREMVAEVSESFSCPISLMHFLVAFSSHSLSFLVISLLE